MTVTQRGKEMSKYRNMLLAALLSGATALTVTVAPMAQAVNEPVAAQAVQVLDDRSDLVTADLRGRIGQIARAEVGVGRPACSKYGPCQKLDWCAMFATWVWERAGVKGVPRKQYVATALGKWTGPGKGTFKRRPAGQVGAPRVGDWVIYGEPGSGVGGHVSVISAVHGDGTITTINGNYGKPSTVKATKINPKTHRAGGRNVLISGYVSPPGA